MIFSIFGIIKLKKKNRENNVGINFSPQFYILKFKVEIEFS